MAGINKSPKSVNLYLTIKPYVIGGLLINTGLFLLLHYQGVMPRDYTWLPFTLIFLNALMCGSCLLFLRKRHNTYQNVEAKPVDSSPSQKRKSRLETLVQTAIFVLVMAFAFSSAIGLIEQKKAEDAALIQESAQETR